MADPVAPVLNTATPGPWRVVRWSAREAEVHGWVDGKAALVCCAALAADARLIAAAPSLRDALKALLHEAEEFARVIPPYSNSQALADARAALRRADDPSSPTEAEHG